MTFSEAMAAVSDGKAVRRDAWGERRAVRLMACPWNRDNSALLLFDRTGRGDVPPFPYTMKGADVLGADWAVIPDEEAL